MTLRSHVFVSDHEHDIEVLRARSFAEQDLVIQDTQTAVNNIHGGKRECSDRDEDLWREAASKFALLSNGFPFLIRVPSLSLDARSRSTTADKQKQSDEQKVENHHFHERKLKRFGPLRQKRECSKGAATVSVLNASHLSHSLPQWN